MFNKNLLKAIPLASASLAGNAFADEGMWQPHQLKEIVANLKKQDLN